MTEPSAPWICGTIPPGVKAAQVPASGWAAASAPASCAAVARVVAVTARPRPPALSPAKAVRRENAVSGLSVDIRFLLDDVGTRLCTGCAGPCRAPDCSACLLSQRLLRDDGFGLGQEDDAEVMIGNGQVIADEKVGGDQPGCSSKLPFTFIDPPNHSAMFACLIGACVEVAIAHGRETQEMSRAESDRANLTKTCCARECHLGDKRRRATVHWAQSA